MLNLKQLETLKHLDKSYFINDGDRYYIDILIPNDRSIFGKFELEFCKNNHIYDYTKCFKALLKKETITDDDINEHLYTYRNVKVTRLQKFTLERAQDLLTRSVVSITEIIARYNEHKLLKQINEL